MLILGLISIIRCWKISLHFSLNLVSYVVSVNYTCNSKLSEELSYHKPLLLSKSVGSLGNLSGCLTFHFPLSHEDDDSRLRDMSVITIIID